MAAYRKETIDPSSTAEQVWKEIRDAVAIGGCAEIRSDPAGDGQLLLITWFEEHVDFSQNEEVF